MQLFSNCLELPRSCTVDRPIFKQTLHQYGELTSADKKALSQDVGKLTWRYSLKPQTVQVPPYEDAEREYLEVAVVEVVLSSRKRAARIAEVVQRAIPYPLLLVLGDPNGFSVNVAHKRLSRAEAGRTVAFDFTQTPWIEEPLSDINRFFCNAVALSRLSQIDFYALYQGYVEAVLARLCAEQTGHFRLDSERAKANRRARLDRCYELERQIKATRAALHAENRFAEKVGLNAKIKSLDASLAEARASL